MKLKYKIIILSFLLFMFFICSSSKVFATTTIPTTDIFGYDVSYDETLFENFNHIIYLYPQGSRLGFDIYVSDFEFNHLYTVNGSSNYMCDISAGYKISSSSSDFGAFSSLNSSSASELLNQRITTAVNSLKNAAVLAQNDVYFIFPRSNYTSGDFSSNFDVYLNNDLLFQLPPPTVEGIIAPQIQATEMEKVMAEILGILPVVLIVVVGILAIRKAILFLTQQLRQA